MKNAAKCDTSCDLQNPVNHQNFERILRFRDMPGSMLVGVSVDTTRPPSFSPGMRSWGGLCVFRSASSECTEPRERDLYRLCCTELLTACCFGGATLYSPSVTCQRGVVSQLFRSCGPLGGAALSQLSFGPPIKQEDPLNLSI